ncbi:Os12g0513001 [Oryza sativa Japonica Group]|uniref:Os12g0513001 protein n=1 Tax=Oryza sativa subsp. japonica TaxID=39947 RepID=A0A0N7KU39_ORYSJ|nr:Os12g0513001 [Oryza sativa Japonica Group]
MDEGGLPGGRGIGSLEADEDDIYGDSQRQHTRGVEDVRMQGCTEVKGVISFKNDPLKHIDLHHVVFSRRTVVGNHSAIVAAAPATPQGAVQW